MHSVKHVSNRMQVFAEGDEDEEEDDSTGGDTDEKLSGAAGKLRGKKVEPQPLKQPTDYSGLTAI